MIFVCTLADDSCLEGLKNFMQIKILKPSVLSNIIKLEAITYKNYKHQTKCEISKVGGHQNTFKIHEYRIINVTCI